MRLLTLLALLVLAGCDNPDWPETVAANPTCFLICNTKSTYVGPTTASGVQSFTGGAITGSDVVSGGP